MNPSVAGRPETRGPFRVAGAWVQQSGIPPAGVAVGIRERAPEVEQRYLWLIPHRLFEQLVGALDPPAARFFARELGMISHNTTASWGQFFQRVDDQADMVATVQGSAASSRSLVPISSTTPADGAQHVLRQAEEHAAGGIATDAAIGDFHAGKLLPRRSFQLA